MHTGKQYNWFAALAR